MIKSFKIQKRKLIFKSLLFVIFVILVIYLNNEVPNKISLENILNDDKILKASGGNQIFFIESHKNEDRIFSNKRQACSVEAAGNLLIIFS